MTQHTEGPWEIDKDPPNMGDGIERKFIQATNCKYTSDGEEVVGTKDICHVHRNVFRMVPGEWEANAALIAAAPETAQHRDELLLMVESLIEVIVEDWGWRERLRRLNRAQVLILSVATDISEAAIAKVEPQTNSNKE